MYRCRERPNDAEGGGMSLDIMKYEPKGDKKSSSFFNEYRLKIY